MLLLSKSTFEKCRKNGMKEIQGILKILKILTVPFSKKTAFLSLAERRRKSSFVFVEVVVCFVLLNFRCLFDCSQFQPFSQSNREGISSSLTNAKNHTFLSFHSFSNFTNCCKQADFKSLSTFLLFNNTQIKKKNKQERMKMQIISVYKT